MCRRRASAGSICNRNLLNLRIHFMLRRLRVTFVAATFVLPFAGLTAQVSPTTSQSDRKPSNTAVAKADYSDEAFVDEQDTTKIDFENDGTYTREDSSRIRIQSDAGVQRFGTLQFSYQSATESIDVAHVRVLKPDGTTILTPQDDI